jgi:NAD(P)-dependent dehydrogenase (short-subunit alcohol dehydrogenase family)
VDGSSQSGPRALTPMKTSTKTHEGRVLVTGAAQGLGRAIALALAERGAQVIATDLTPPHETVTKISKITPPRSAAPRRQHVRQDSNVFAHHCASCPKARNGWCVPAIRLNLVMVALAKRNYRSSLSRNSFDRRLASAAASAL